MIPSGPLGLIALVLLANLANLVDQAFQDRQIFPWDLEAQELLYLLTDP